MAEPLLSTRNLAKSFGGLTATDDLSLDVLPREVHAVIGPNGAGKTTLISQLSGELQREAGSVFFGGQDITALPPERPPGRGPARSLQCCTSPRSFAT